VQLELGRKVRGSAHGTPESRMGRVGEFSHPSPRIPPGATPFARI
jgi:hypothetical protein